MGEDFFVSTHDKLDSKIAFYQILKETNQLFSINPFNEVSSYMNGTLRGIFQSGFNIGSLIYAVFPTHLAFKINFLLTRIIAYVGMILLLQKFTKQKHWIFYTVSLIFAISPFYTVYGMSISGIPILIWSFINLSESIRVRISYSIIILFAFYSSFALIGLILCFVLTIIAGIRLRKTKKIFNPFSFGVVLLGISFMITEYHMILLNLVAPFDGHRQEFNLKTFGLNTFRENGISVFFNMQQHVGKKIHLILFVVLVSIILSLDLDLTIKKIREKLFLLLGGIVIICLTYSIYYWEIWYVLFSKSSFFNKFQWHRIYFLLPTFWYLLFGLSLIVIHQKIKLVKHSSWMIPAILLIQFISNFYDNLELRVNFQNLYKKQVNTYTFSSYYAQEQFMEIKTEVKDSKVISVGLPPIIAAYNGLNTLDGYVNNFPLDYKKDFQKIIQKELDKNWDLKKYFCYWGSRCYAYSAEIGKDFGLNNLNTKKQRIKHIETLEFNINQLKKLDCKYIVSSTKIKNLNNNKISLVETYKHSNSYWDIFLYKIK